MQIFLEQSLKNNALAQRLFGICLASFLLLLLIPETLLRIPYAAKNIAALYGVGLLFVTVAWVVYKKRFSENAWEIPRSLLWIGCVVLALFVTQLFQGLTSMAIFGIVMEPGTLVSFFAALGVLIGVSLLHSHLKEDFVRISVAALRVALNMYIVVYVSALIIPALGPVFFVGAFEPTIYIALGIVLNVWTLFGNNLRVSLQTVFGGMGVVGFCALVVAQAHEVLVFLALAVVFLAWKLSSQGINLRKVYGVYMFAALCFGVGFFSINIPVSSDFLAGQEYRPSIQSSIHVTLSLYGESLEKALFGSGLQTFDDVWAQYRPPALNRTPLWNEDISNGYGLIWTLLATTGSIFAFVMMFAFFVMIIRGVLVQPNEHDDYAPLFFSMFMLLALFCWVYTPGLSVFIFLSYTLALFLMRDGDTWKPQMLSHPLLVTVVAAIFLLIGGACLLGVSVRLYTLQHYSSALAAWEDGEGIEGTINLLEQSLNFERYVPAMQNMSELLTQKAEVLLQNETFTEKDVETIEVIIGDAVGYAYDVDRRGGTTYRAYLQAGTIELRYSLLRHDSDAFDKALGRYRAAQFVAPTHPLPYFLEAQALYLSGDTSGALLALRKTLYLKPDYSEAIQLYNRIEQE